MINLPTIEQAARQEYEYYGSTLTTNTALKAGLLVALATVGLLSFQIVRLSREVVSHKPLIVRVSEVGKAEAISYQYADYTPQDAEIRYFLNAFFTGYYGRNHATIASTYPASLAYLSAAKFAEVDALDQKSKWLAKFLLSSDDDAAVEVRNIALDESQKPVYRAQVEYQKVFTSSAGIETKRQTFNANLSFRIDPLLASKNNDLVRVNPLGFAIFWLESDQAFQ